MKKFSAGICAICVCLCTLLCACGDDTGSTIVGDTWTTVYGITAALSDDGGTITADGGVYSLGIGETYTLTVSLIQGGGSSPAALNGIGITFGYDENIVEISPVDSDGGDYIRPMFYVTGISETDDTVITVYSGSYSCIIDLSFTQ